MRQLREFEYNASTALFTDIHCDDMLRFVEKIEFELEYKVTFDNRTVCAFVRDQCKVLNRLLPLIYKLQNNQNEITDRVSALIVTELGFNVWSKDRKAVTVKYLLDNDLLAHERELSRIHDRAIKEAHIHKKVLSIKSQLEELSLHVEPDQGK